MFEMVSLGKAALVGGVIVLGAFALMKKASGGGGSAGSDSGTVGIVVTMLKRPSLDGLDAALPNDVTVRVTGRATGGDPAPLMTLSIEMIGPAQPTWKQMFSWDASNPFGQISPVGIGTDYSTQKTFSPNDLMLAMLSSSGYGTYQVRGAIHLENDFGKFDDWTGAVTFKIGVAPTGTIYTAPPT